MSNFFSRLSYSFGNEDWITESKALKIKRGDRVLCITASGDRPFHLLLDDCRELVAIDINPIQNHLLSLKCAAMRRLDYENYLSFLGAQSGGNRIATLNKLTPDMPQEAAHFWQKNHIPVAKGVLYQGAVEKFSYQASRAINFFRGKKVDYLFGINDINKQKDFVKRHWDTFIWRRSFDIILHPLFTRLVVRDPGLYNHIKPSLHISSYIYQSMHACLNRCLAKENALISLILKGDVSKDAYPAYLTEKGHRIIRKRLDRITRVVTMDLIHYLEGCPDESFDCFSLSDVASYITQQDFVKLMNAVYRTAKPGARFSIRQFMSHHKIPEAIAPYFQRDKRLEKQLEIEDRCFLYRFMTGTIIKKQITL